MLFFFFVGEGEVGVSRVGFYCSSGYFYFIIGYMDKFGRNFKYVGVFVLNFEIYKWLRLYFLNKIE